MAPWLPNLPSGAQPWLLRGQLPCLPAPPRLLEVANRCPLSSLGSGLRRDRVPSCCRLVVLGFGREVATLPAVGINPCARTVAGRGINGSPQLAAPPAAQVPLSWHPVPQPAPGPGPCSRSCRPCSSVRCRAPPPPLLRPVLPHSSAKLPRAGRCSSRQEESLMTPPLMLLRSSRHHWPIRAEGAS